MPNANVNVPVPPTALAKAPLAPTIEVKSLSIFLLDAAICLVRESVRIQQNYDENAEQDTKNTQISTYRACVIGALFSSMAFFEAAINEVFLDAVDCLPKKARKSASKKKRRKKNVTSIPVAANKIASYRNGELNSNIVKNMAQTWLEQQTFKSWIDQNPKFNIHFIKKDHGNNIPYWRPALDKYQLALGLNKKRAIGQRNPKRENVETLRRFRNTLIHFKPAASVSAPGRGLELVEYDVRITKRRVEALVNSDINRPAAGYAHEQDFLASNFPYDCLSAAFAKMALQSILQFDDEFSKRMVVCLKRPLKRSCCANHNGYARMAPPVIYATDLHA
jgi:hypothetical protein